MKCAEIFRGMVDCLKKIELIVYLRKFLFFPLLLVMVMYKGFQNLPTPDARCWLLFVFASGTFEPKFQIINLNSETLRIR